MDDVVLNISDELLDRLGSARSVLSVTDDGGTQRWCIRADWLPSSRPV